MAVSVIGEENLDVWVWDVARGGLSRITTDPADDGPDPAWTPDSEKVVFQSDQNGALGLFWRAADGTGDVERLMTVEDVNTIRPTSVSPDGAHLLFHTLSAETNWDIGMLSIGDGRSSMLVQSDAAEYDGEISPDGSWIAYTSDEAGSADIYVRRFPDLSDRQRISTEGGRGPVWSSDGQEIIFRRFGGGAQMMAVAVTTEPTFTIGTPEVLFEEPYFRSGCRHYDLAPDGRLLMIKQNSATVDIHVVLDWFEELRARVPTN